MNCNKFFNRDHFNLHDQLKLKLFHASDNFQWWKDIDIAMVNMNMRNSKFVEICSAAKFWDETKQLYLSSCGLAQTRMFIRTIQTLKTINVSVSSSKRKKHQHDCIVSRHCEFCWWVHSYSTHKGKHRIYRLRIVLRRWNHKESRKSEVWFLCEALCAVGKLKVSSCAWL